MFRYTKILRSQKEQSHHNRNMMGVGNILYNNFSWRDLLLGLLRR